MSRSRIEEKYTNMFQRLKKRKKGFKKMAYTRKPIKMNEIYCERCFDGVWGGELGGWEVVK